MVNSFINNFWDSDWDGTMGYDALVTRLKDGKKLYDAFTDFVRNRAKIEDDYGKRLINLAQVSGGQEETGTLRQAWDSIRKETENIGLIHCDLSKQLNDLAERSTRFREVQKQERLKIDDAMRKEQKDKKICHENLLKAKKLYEQRCKESDFAKDAYASKSSYTPKEEEKLKRQNQKCKTAAEAADIAYLNAVKQLEEYRQKYIIDMEDACSKFQMIEEKRIQFLRNELWTYTNLGSGHIINMSEKYELSRKVIENCNEKLDLQLFINVNNTGTIRPPPIEYENFYHKENTPIIPTVQFQTEEFASKSVSDQGLKNEEFSRPVNISINHSMQLSKNHPPQSSSNSCLTNPSNNPKYLVQIDPEYTNVTEIRIPSSSVRVAQAAFAYQSQSEQELSLDPGDIIEVRNIVDETWGIGTLNGKLGAFPLAFVDIIH